MGLLENEVHLFPVVYMVSNKSGRFDIELIGLDAYINTWPIKIPVILASLLFTSSSTIFLCTRRPSFKSPSALSLPAKIMLVRPKASGSVYTFDLTSRRWDKSVGSSLFMAAVGLMSDRITYLEIKLFV